MSKNYKQDTQDAFRGAKAALKSASELITGAAAVVTIAMAAAYAHEHYKPGFNLYFAGFAVILMALILLGVVGKYLVRKGGQYEH